MTHIAGYPVRQTTVEAGDLNVRLYVVRRLEDYVDAEALLRDADAPEPPYWAHVWPGSRALAALMACRDCGGRRVADIGCGLGLAGIVAAMRGATVALLDTAHAGLQFAAANAALNHCRAAAVETDVRRPGLRGRFNYCLAADVTYDPALQAGVAAFIAAYLAPGGSAWCAESVRTFDRGFRDACEQHGLHVTESEVHQTEDGHDSPVRITHVRHHDG